MKTRKGLLSRLKGIFTNNNYSNDPDEANNNLINSNINPTNQQTKVKKHKGDSKTKGKSYYNNKDIKYRNNNKKKRKKVEQTTAKHKIDSSDEDNTDKEDKDIMPGLQDRERPDSSSKNDGEYN